MISRPPITVVGAVIIRDGSVLAAQRASGRHLAGLWEFPGGKIESGESASDALRREIVEELGCQIDVGVEIVTTPHAYETVSIELTTFYVTIRSGQPHASEHAELRWVPFRDLSHLAWAPADVPTVEAILLQHGD
ncbi:(deoxy)nucleoside triphosphate pyrophosphohydrolase [Microbacterium sp. LWH12-1.2]|uniref:(deoxy)nucleoside triphosphate pyrophosphohydrolase n=1 Tax=Microbacterium sp. LWH12-1.2 TaxID=3135259 RepID=UPI003435DBF4